MMDQAENTTTKVEALAFCELLDFVSWEEGSAPPKRVQFDWAGAEQEKDSAF
jgi:hypothetical protein